MTYNDILAHCERQIKRLERFANYPEDNPARREYEEHKMVAELIKSKNDKPSTVYEKIKDLYLATLHAKLNRAINNNCIRNVQTPDLFGSFACCDDCHKCWVNFLNGDNDINEEKVMDLLK